MIMRRRQQGVALMIVLLVVTIATVLSVSIAKNQHRAISSATRYFDRAQAYYYATGGEEYARQLLARDFKERPEQDDLSEVWAATDLAFEFESGEVDIVIQDLQSVFNLNDFISSNEGNSLIAEKLSLLSSQIGLNPSWMDELLDFSDIDGEVRPGGAEDYYYLGLERPYRTSGQPLQDLSEIRLLRTMTDEAYGRLSEVMTVLPTAGGALNVNTAPPMVLQTLATDLNLESATSLVESRLRLDGFESVEQFLQQPELAGLAVKSGGLGVQSSFFKVNTRARFGSQIVFLTSFVFRNATTGKMTVYQRKNNERFIPFVPEEEILANGL
ncbi:type II secretion system minor pseudopilin GspK [Pseudomonadales bacterium]|nr:type II secretion system minor pseudopilin GspK [Pseudomonadales bacterium]